MNKNVKFNFLTVCLDMCGCPNRCRHCWMGHSPNGRLDLAELRFVHDAFRPFVQGMEVFDWTREPDYGDDYRERWRVRTELSDAVTPHFELMSFYRAARDADYVPWLADLGVERVQLTIFGGEEMTDRWVGRRGAYREMVQSMEQLLENGIAPCIQVFLNRETARELDQVEVLIRKLRLEARCREIGREFGCFVYAGGCDGANEANYPIWPTRAEVDAIPPMLAEYTLRHFGVSSLEDVFGRSEAQWYRELAQSTETNDIGEHKKKRDPVVFLDSEFNAYPNVSTPAPHWRLGNLCTDGAEAILDAFLQNRSPAQRARKTVPLGEMVCACGNPRGEGLFTRWDYTVYLLNRYCREQLA